MIMNSFFIQTATEYIYVYKCFISCSKTSQVTIFINTMDDSWSYTCNNGCILFLCCFIFLLYIKLYGKRGGGGGATTLLTLSSVASVSFSFAFIIILMTQISVIAQKNIRFRVYTCLLLVYIYMQCMFKLKPFNYRRDVYLDYVILCMLTLEE